MQTIPCFYPDSMPHLWLRWDGRCATPVWPTTGKRRYPAKCKVEVMDYTRMPAAPFDSARQGR